MRRKLRGQESIRVSLHQGPEGVSSSVCHRVKLGRLCVRRSVLLDSFDTTVAPAVDEETRSRVVSLGIKSDRADDGIDRP